MGRGCEADAVRNRDRLVGGTGPEAPPTSGIHAVVGPATATRPVHAEGHRDGGPLRFLARGDSDYCLRFRHALMPTRPVPNKSRDAGSGTGVCVSNSSKLILLIPIQVSVPNWR